jgi:hypothetical protein
MKPVGFANRRYRRAGSYRRCKNRNCDRVLSSNAVILSQPKHIRAMIDKFCLIADLVTERMVPVECGTRLCKVGVVGQDESPLLDTAIYKYRELIGGLSYVACGSRPDICFIVNQLARYANSPRVAHWNLQSMYLQIFKTYNKLGYFIGQGSSFGDINWFTVNQKKTLKLRV